MTKKNELEYIEDMVESIQLINYEILVDIVTKKLPVLLEQLQPLRLKLESQYYQALPE